MGRIRLFLNFPTRPIRILVNGVDMLGTLLFGYAKNVVNEVIGVGRAETLIDSEGPGGPGAMSCHLDNWVCSAANWSRKAKSEKG